MAAIPGALDSLFEETKMKVFKDKKIDYFFIVNPVNDEIGVYYFKSLKSQSSTRNDFESESDIKSTYRPSTFKKVKPPQKRAYTKAEKE